MSNESPLTPTFWSSMLGILATASLGWIGATSKKTGEHAVKIAVLETDVKYIKEGMERIEDHFGTRPKE